MMTESYDYRAVVDAVMKFGDDQWSLIGNELGMPYPQMTAVTHEIPTAAGKLQAIISYKRNELGDRELIKQLLEACGNIPQPILGMVKQHLDTHPTGRRSASGEETSNTTGIPSLTVIKLT